MSGDVQSAARAGTPAPDLAGAPRSHFIGGPGSWLSEYLGRLQPRIMDHFEALQATAWFAADPVALELCRLRMAELLGDSEGLAHRTPQAVAAGLDEAQVAALAEWWRSPLFNEREKAQLAFAEQFNTSVAHVSDADVEALLEHMTEGDVAGFAAALYAIEFEARIRMVAGRVLAPEAM